MQWFIDKKIFISRSDLVRTILLIGMKDFMNSYSGFLDKFPDEVSLSDKKDVVTLDYMRAIKTTLPPIKKIIDMEFLKTNWGDVLEKIQSRNTVEGLNK